MITRCNKKILSLILSMMLIVAMAFSMTACSDSNTGNSEAGTENNSGTEADGTVLGEGDTVFTFVVVNAEGNEKSYEIHTDKKTVGDALVELELIAGEDGQYGLYVKTVDGITLDYEKDGKYWAFYVNGEYAMTGVDTTEIVEGDSYSFKAE